MVDGSEHDPAEPVPVEHELAPDTEPTRPNDRRVWFVAAVVLMVVAMGGAAIAVVRHDGASGTGSPVPLSLLQQPTFAAVGAAVADDGSMRGPSRIEYHHEGSWPDLGSSGPVYRLSAVESSTSQVASMAAALGVQGSPTQTESGWQVDDGTHLLVVESNPTGTTVSYGPSYATGPCVVGSVPPGEPVPDLTEVCNTSSSSGGVASDSSQGSTVTTGTVFANPPPQPPFTTPANLPDEGAAEDRARQVLGDMGVLDGEWQAVVRDGGMVSMSCAVPADGTAGTACPLDPIVMSREVTFTKVVDGQPAEGLFWNVEVGDDGVIGSLQGTEANVEKLADYPLVTVADAFDQIVRGDQFQAGTDDGFATPKTFAAVGSAIAEPELTAPTTTVEVGGGGAGEASLPMSTTTWSGLIDPAEPVPGPVPMPTVVPEPGDPIVIDVTGVERGLVVAVGSEDGQPVGYLVPTYRFTGTYASGGGEWSMTVVAIDPSLVQSVDQLPAPDQPPGSVPTTSQVPGCPPGAACVAPDVTVETGPAPSTTTTVVPTGPKAPPVTGVPAG